MEPWQRDILNHLRLGAGEDVMRWHEAGCQLLEAAEAYLLGDPFPSSEDEDRALAELRYVTAQARRVHDAMTIGRVK